METIYFLIIVGICAFAVVWFSGRVERKRSLGKKTQFKQPSEKLIPTSHNRLSRKDEIWEARRKFADKDLTARRRFVPKSEAAAEPEYDGFSRRARHHLAPTGQVKKP